MFQKIRTQKKPLAVAVDQAVLLRGDSGYKVVHEGNVLHP
jgi:hypothetical protein